MNDKAGKKKKSIKKELNAVYQEDSLPIELSGEYRIFSCLKYTTVKRVYLLKKIKDNTRYILKCHSGEYAALLQKEYETLTLLKEEFLPKAVCCFTKDKTTYLLREYIPGETLAQQVDRKGPYEKKQAVEIMLAICNCVKILHQHGFVHRDLKPQNILYAKDGTYKFIDMDTVREYKEEGMHDTVYMGSQGIAAPEQFGFGQTSSRTDIYGLGICFLYLLTGSYVKTGEEWKHLPYFFRRTVSKCMEFDPKRRYSSVDAFSARLRLIQKLYCRNLLSRWCGGAAIVVFAGCICFLGVRQYRKWNCPVSFANPQIEEAVRQELGLDPDTPVYLRDCKKVTTLILCGDKIFSSWEEHQAWHDTYFFEFDHAARRMTPAELSDLKYLTELTTLALDNQGIEDIRCLKHVSLNRLSIMKNNISDLSSLKGNTAMTVLLVADNPVSSLSFIENMINLKELDISDTKVESIDRLEGTSLVSLDCSFTNLTDYTVLSTLEQLTELQVSNMTSDNIKVLNTLDQLRIIGVFSSDLVSLEELSNLHGLECLDVGDCQNLETLNGINVYPRLSYLGIASTGIRDISPITDLQLTMLDITNTPLESYAPLTDCKLELLFIDEEKVNMIPEDRITQIIVAQ